MTAGSRSSWRKGRLARCSRRDSPAPAPYPVRFVAANSAFTVFRSAKRRKPLCCRSSSPKVFRLSGSPLNHRRRFAGYAHQGEALSNTVQNEFRTMRAKRCRGRSTGQRLPPRSEAFSHDRSHRRAVIARRNINRRERRPRRSVSKRVNNFAKAGAYFPSLRLCINLTRYALCRKGQRTSGGRFAHFDRL